MGQVLALAERSTRIEGLDVLRSSAALVDELHRARDRVEQLEELLGLVKQPALHLLRMTPNQRKIVGFLLRRETATTDQIHTALYGAMPDCDIPDPKIIDVFISRIRKELRPYGVKLEHKTGALWFFRRSEKAKLLAVLEVLAAEPCGQL